MLGTRCASVTRKAGAIWRARGDFRMPLTHGAHVLASHSELYALSIASKSSVSPAALAGVGLSIGFCFLPRNACTRSVSQIAFSYCD